MSGCAVGPHGELLDASQIAWQHDVDSDDDTPLPVPNPPSIPASSRPVRQKIPAAKLTTDNTEAPALKSQILGIREQKRQAELAAEQKWQAALLAKPKRLSFSTSSASTSAKPGAQGTPSTSKEHNTIVASSLPISAKRDANTASLGRGNTSDVEPTDVSDDEGNPKPAQAKGG
jgi:hypothetical protein